MTASGLSGCHREFWVVRCAVFDRVRKSELAKKKSPPEKPCVSLRSVKVLLPGLTSQLSPGPRWFLALTRPPIPRGTVGDQHVLFHGVTGGGHERRGHIKNRPIARSRCNSCRKKKGRDRCCGTDGVAGLLCTGAQHTSQAAHDHEHCGLTRPLLVRKVFVHVRTCTCIHAFFF